MPGEAFEGRLVAIHVAARRGELPHAVAEARVSPGGGIEGDRNLGRHLIRGGGDVTLIAGEDLDALEKERGLVLDAAGSRRNLLTRGVPLADLVGRSFTVGEVLLLGDELCEPCR